MKTLLLIIDMQNDFCTSGGALYVPGAETDVLRLSVFIRACHKKIGAIWLTQDNHQFLDIAHPVFWRDSRGNPPLPFTTISYADVRTGKWIPRFQEEEVVRYLDKLEETGEYRHTIWPEHCIWGSEGAAIVASLMESVSYWARSGNYFRLLTKGMHPLTEHFGAFRANVPREDAPETAINPALIEELNSYDVIWIAGEAQSHCVANSVKQLMDFPGMMEKLVILEDCMSPVKGCEQLASSIFGKAKERGACFTTTTAVMSKL